MLFVSLTACPKCSCVPSESQETLLPHWGLRLLTTWTWLKVTTKGVPVFPVDSKHKQPREVLLLASNSPTLFHVTPACTWLETSAPAWLPRSSPTTASSGSATSVKAGCVTLPAELCVAAVPSLIHSEKPAIFNRLLEFLVGHDSSSSNNNNNNSSSSNIDSSSSSIDSEQQEQACHAPTPTTATPLQQPESARCLELFARRLHPNWTSVGNQVFKLQDTRLFAQSGL